MTTATTIPAGGTREYLPDRYDRLRNGCETIASDDNVTATESIFGADGLRAFTHSLIDARILDGLSEHGADTVIMLLILDFTQGLERMAWRLTDWMNEDGNSVGRKDDDTAAVVAVLALSLGLVMGAFAGPEFEQASAVERMYEQAEQ
jgi:hypothetical protein